MAIEIERKFLVCGDAWRNDARDEAIIRQAYLASGERSTTRVRITNGSQATVTIKSKRAELRRLEIEYSISVFDGEALVSLRHSGLIEKVRFTVPWQQHLWEVDVFSGDNEGLVIAEIELRHEDEKFVRPPWVGAEITGQSQYTTDRWRGTPSANGRGLDPRPPADKGSIRLALQAPMRIPLRRADTTSPWGEQRPARSAH